MKNSFSNVRNGFILNMAIGAVCVCSLRVEAETGTPSPFDLGRPQDVGARAMALAGSYSAVAEDASALYYNAAGLSGIKKHEWQLSLERNALTGIDRAVGYPSLNTEQVDFRVQSLAYVLPIPTVRGGLTFAFGYSRPRSFSDVIGYGDSLAATRGAYAYDASGTLDQYRVGMGIDLAPDVAFGLALGYLSGSENIQIHDGVQSQYLRSYGGLNIEPSLMIKFTPRSKVGISIVAWEHIFKLDETYQTATGAPLETQYRLEHPMQAKAGWSYQGDSYLLAADLRFNAWSQYKFGFHDAAALTQADYRDESVFSIGGEKFIAPWNLTLRGGYAYGNSPDRSFTSTYGSHRFTAGAGLLASNAMSLDFAYSYAFWGQTGEGLVLDNREQKGMLSVAYRY